MEKINVRQLASLIDARLNCIETKNKEWEDRHEEEIEKIIKLLPHGSGLDCSTVLIYEKSTGNKIIILSGYHAMDEMGGYTRWITFKLTIKASLMFGYNITITGNFGKDQDIKEYLHDVYNECLTTDQNY